MWAHASDDLPEPANPAPLAADPTPADSDRYAQKRANVTPWKSRDAAACIALSSLLPESEETHFTQVRTASEFLTAIKARNATPTTVSLGRLFLPFLFPDLASFERTADLITHLRSLDSSYRGACIDAQLALLPPPMAITIYLIATSLPYRLASVRDALLLKHPSKLTIEVLESALKDVERNLRSVASASGVVPPPLFHGCTVPQLPTFTASLATATTNVTASAVTTSSRSRGRSGKRGGQGVGGGGGGDVASGGGGSAGARGAPRAAAGDSPAVAGGRDAQVQPPSPQSSSQPTADPVGADFRGEDPGGASSRGAGVGAESVPVRGPGSGGAGGGAEPVTAGDSSIRGAGVRGAVLGGATTGGAPSTGPGEPGTDPVTSSGAGFGGGTTGSLESGPGATTALDTTPPPHPYPTRHQARPPPPPVSGLRTLGLPSPSPPLPPSPLVSGHPLPPPDPSPAVFPPPLPPLFPPLSHTWPSRRSPRARPSSPVPFTDLRTALFRSSPPRLSPSVLPSPPESALTASLSTPVTDYYRTYRPVLSRILASLVTDPRASLSSVSALTAAVTEFASTRCFDYATSLVAAPPTGPLAIGGESALGCDALEDRQFELEFLAAASPHLCAMLLAPEGDPGALDIPTPRTYADAVSGPWASQWRAAMDSEMASYRSTGTYVDEVPPLGANVVDGMWIFRVKRPLGSPPPSSADPTLFVRRGSTLFFVLVYVNDLAFATAHRVSLADVMLELQKRHTCTDLGELRHYLGLQITKDRATRTIILSLSHMVQQVLQRFELQQSFVQCTPLAVDHRLTETFLEEPFEPSGPYAELVGRLMYLMTCTRPDLAFPLSILARFVAPGRHRPVHWTAAVRVAKYLATTSGVGLVLGGRQDVVLTGHCESSYADDAETHRSTQGYCFSLGSGVVSWRSTRSSSVSTSTAEAEIYAGAMAAQELH
ncbi:unnamed protein product [Closterium sp. NIES-54]